MAYSAKSVAIVLSTAAVLVGTATICADVPVVSFRTEDQPIRSDAQNVDIAPQRPAESAGDVREAGSSSGRSYWTDLTPGVGAVHAAMDFSVPPAPERKTIVLPAGPSSVAMFITAIGSLGAWQVVRSARGARFRLGPIPEWYHTGGPIQIGGATAIDLYCTQPALCALNERAGERQFRHRPRRDLPSRRESQFLQAVDAPRGPPRLGT